MNVNRIVEVQNGDTLGTLRRFLEVWWDLYELDALLAFHESPEDMSFGTQWITEKNRLSEVNPFAPVMVSNAARAASQFMLDHPQKRIAMILRPCELRSLTELQKKHPQRFEAAPAIFIGVDCLGTLPPEEYSHSVQESGMLETTSAALRNAATGGLHSQYFRTACQLCDSPVPEYADLTISILGVDTDQYLLFIARDEESADQLGLIELTDAPASEYNVSHRETVAGAVADLRAAVRKNRFAEVSDAHGFNDFGRLLAWFARCDLCAQCLQACPSYEGELEGFFGIRQNPSAGNRPLAELAAVGRWLAACSGCGMCEQACSKDIPLTLFLSKISHSIRDEMSPETRETARPMHWRQENRLDPHTSRGNQ